MLIFLTITMKLQRTKTRDYTTINNGIVRDKRISLKTKGLFLTVMALPDDWDFSVRGIISLMKERKASVYSAIDELIEFGYCQRIEERDSSGKFVGNNYSFYEDPQPDLPHTENPHTENRDTDNRTQCNKESLKESRKEKEYCTPDDLPKKKTEKGTRIDPMFVVTDDLIDWFIEKKFTFPVEVETEKFINYYTSKTGQNAVKKDWPATWRNWMLNAQEYRGGFPTGKPQPTEEEQRRLDDHKRVREMMYAPRG